jgi:hypothetical protein
MVIKFGVFEHSDFLKYIYQNILKAVSNAVILST